MDLHTLVGHIEGGLGGQQLGHADLADRVLPRRIAQRRGVDQLAARLHAGGHRRELVADGLEAADGLAERLALLGVVKGLVERVLPVGQAAGGADQALSLQLPHDLREAAALLAQEGVGGHPHVVEGEHRRVRSVHPELLELLGPDHAGRVHRHQEDAEALVGGVGVGLGDQHDHRCPHPVGDVGLRPADHPLVAVPAGSGSYAGHVRAGVGLGDAQAQGDLAGDGGPHPPLLLLLGAELQQRRDDHVGVDRQRHQQPTAAAPGDLLGQHQVGEVVAALTAVGLRHRQAEQARASHLGQQRRRPGRALPLLHVGHDLPVHEGPDGPAQLIVVLGEDEPAGPLRALPHDRCHGAIVPVARTVCPDTATVSARPTPEGRCNTSFVGLGVMADEVRFPRWLAVWCRTCPARRPASRRVCSILSCSSAWSGTWRRHAGCWGW